MEIYKFFGALALTFILLAISRYILNLKTFKILDEKYDKIQFVKKITPYLLKYHKYFGMLAVVCAAVHFYGLRKYIQSEKIFVYFGIAAFIFLVFTGIAAFIMKKAAIDHKKRDMNIHMILALITLLLVIGHRTIPA